MNNRFICTILVLATGLGASLRADGQSKRKGFGGDSRARVKLMEEAAKRIEDAKARQAAEEAIRRAEGVIQSGSTKDLRAAAEGAAAKVALTPDQIVQAAVAKAAIASAVEGASDEAAAILNAAKEHTGKTEVAQAAAGAGAGAGAKAADKPRATIEVTPAPDPAVASVAPARVSGAAPEGALPGDEFPAPVLDRRPETLVPPARQEPERKSHTRIDAKDGALFDASAKLMVFKGDVAVDHKVFDLSCDTLEVFLYKDVKIGEGGSEKDEGDLIELTPKGNRRSDIMKAIATGYVQITKRSSSGVNQVGKCRQAVYEDTTGDLIMRGLPQVQRGSDIVIATDEKTTIIFKEDGDMEVHGPHRTEIVKSTSTPDGN